MDNVAGNRGEQRLDMPRARWGRRFAIAFTLVIVLIAGGYLGWVSSSAKTMERQVALYRDAGEPIELKDFIVTGVDDSDNAVIPLREAAKIDEKTDVWKAYEKADTGEVALPLTDKEIAAFDAAMKENATTLANVDDALLRKGVDWKIAYRSPAISTLLPDLNQQRQLARLLKHRAMLNYQRGDHAEAVRDLRRVMFIGRTIGHQPTLVSHLVSIGTQSMAADALSEMASGLKIGDGDGEVKAADVSQVVAELLDDKSSRDGYVHAMNGERAFQLDTTRCLLDGRLSLNQLSGGGMPGGTGTVAVAAAARIAGKPMFQTDAVLMMRHTTAMRDAMRQSPDYPTFKAKRPDVPKEVTDTLVRHLLAKIMLPSFDRSAQMEFRIAAERKMTAVALAIRQYALDHNGARPARLDELVPKYLAALPADPFRADGKPFSYVTDPDQPLLYSVGEDGQDQSASMQPINPNRNAKFAGRWDRLDAVLHLTLQPRPEPEPAEVQSDGVGDLRLEPTTAPSDAPTTQP